MIEIELCNCGKRSHNQVFLDYFSSIQQINELKWRLFFSPRKKYINNLLYFIRSMDKWHSTKKGSYLRKLFILKRSVFIWCSAPQLGDSLSWKRVKVLLCWAIASRLGGEWSPAYGLQHSDCCFRSSQGRDWKAYTWRDLALGSPRLEQTHNGNVPGMPWTAGSSPVFPRPQATQATSAYAAATTWLPTPIPLDYFQDVTTPAASPSASLRCSLAEESQFWNHRIFMISAWRSTLRLSFKI